MLVKKAPNTITVSHINIRLSISFLIIKLLLLEFLAAVFILTFSFPFSYLDAALGLSQIFYSPQNIFLIIFIIIKSYLSFIVIFQWLNEYYEITPTKIVYRKGFIFHKIDHYNFSHIKSIGFHQGLLGKIFNFGTIHMYDWFNREKVYLYLIHNPKRYFHIIESLLPNLYEKNEKIRDHFIEDSDDKV